MKEPGIPSDEEKRLSLLEQYGVIYSPAEERFDRITRLARRIFRVPIALVSLVTENTQWFKSCQGLTTAETSREISFCGHAILGEDTFIVPDTHKHPDFADNPLVINEPFIRFYAGRPIHFNSVKLGTLCIIDRRPRHFKPSDFDTLRSLALWVENELKLQLYTESQRELMNKFTTMERKILIDALTGCWNQRGFDKLLEIDLSRSHRKNEPVTLILIDIGNFIEAHKEFSTLVRNTVVKEVAQKIRQSVRSHDLIGRLEGFKFIIYLNDCGKHMGEVLTQRLLRHIAIERIRTDEHAVSAEAVIGVTSNEGTDIWSSTLLIDTVNAALREAKKNNTNNTFYFKSPKIGGMAPL